ncbi:hypothetical protein GCM10009022_06120 [Vreelandella titanicae]
MFNDVHFEANMFNRWHGWEVGGVSRSGLLWASKYRLENNNHGGHGSVAIPWTQAAGR